MIFLLIKDPNCELKIEQVFGTKMLLGVLSSLGERERERKRWT